MDEKTTGKVQVSLADMDLPSWKYDLEADLAIINALLVDMHKVTPAEDTKLQHLIAHVRAKVAAPINGSNKKVLIFCDPLIFMIICTFASFQHRC
ncbi:MAG: hypothetical protein IPN95_30290 [Bacteroidetes bacterium]|nr:hypothetical protein [Bacteroidota bacterium]